MNRLPLESNVMGLKPRPRLPDPEGKDSQMVGVPGAEGLPDDRSAIHAPMRTPLRLNPEIDIIYRAQLGDAAAWELLVRQNIGWLLRTCSRWSLSRPRAEDLVQEVFFRVFRTLSSYRGELSGFRTWLGRIARNLMIDDYRRERQERRTVSFDSADERTQCVIRALPSSGCGPEVCCKRREEREAVRHAFQLLEPEFRRAIVLHDVKGLTYEEISRLLNRPLGTVKSTISRGRVELARCMRRQLASPHRIGSHNSEVA